MNEPTTWRKEISRTMLSKGDGWDHAEWIDAKDAGTGMTVDALLDYPFDSDFGLPQGPDFVVYTRKWVYIPWEYDGSEFVVAIRRNPGNPRWFIGHPTEFGCSDG